VEEVAPVQGERIIHPAGAVRLFERGRVHPQHPSVDADLFFTARNDHTIPEPAPEEPERLPQGTARVLLIELGPEERDDCIASLEPLPFRAREVREQREPFRLAEERAYLAPIGRAQIQRPQRPQLDHQLTVDAIGRRGSPRSHVHHG
jgi:hypothetical protein